MSREELLSAIQVIQQATMLLTMLVMTTDFDDPVSRQDSVDLITKLSAVPAQLLNVPTHS